MRRKSRKASLKATNVGNSGRTEPLPKTTIAPLWPTVVSHDPNFRRKATLLTVIRDAVVLLNAKSGGIYEYDREHERLTVIADFNRPQNVGKNLKKGEGMAGKLIETNEPYMIIDDYEAWKGKSRSYAGRPYFSAVIEVPLIWEGKTVGVL